MASRIEKTTRRVAGRVRKATKSAASATRTAADVLDRVEKATRRLDSRRTIKKASRMVGKVAKSAAVGAVAAGIRRALEAAGKKMGRPKPSRAKKALKVAGTVAAVAGAAVLARKVVRARRDRDNRPKAMEPEVEREPGSAY